MSEGNAPLKAAGGRGGASGAGGGGGSGEENVPLMVGFMSASRRSLGARRPQSSLAEGSSGASERAEEGTEGVGAGVTAASTV